MNYDIPKRRCLFHVRSLTIDMVPIFPHSVGDKTDRIERSQTRCWNLRGCCSWLAYMTSFGLEYFHLKYIHTILKKV